MTKTPSVSVIIVNYQRSQMLARVLKALEFQNYNNFEVIAVSDIAPDNRPDSPMPIKWVQFCEANISAARNRGLSVAAGEIVAFVDDDAVPEFRWLSHLVQPYSDPTIGFVGGFVRGRNGVSFQWKALTFDTKGVDYSAPLSRSTWTVFPPNEGTVLKAVGTNCSFRRSAVFEIGGFDEAYRYFLDETDLCLRFARAGWSGAIVPFAEVHHGSAVGPYRANTRVPKNLTEICASMTYFLKTYCDTCEIDKAFASFKEMQLERILKYFHYGMLGRDQFKNLSDNIDTGAKLGLKREKSTPLSGLPSNKFANVALPLKTDQVTLVSNITSRRSMRKRAKALSAEGKSVTLFVPRFTHNNLVVRFNTEGYWEHDFGLFGHAEREKPRLRMTPTQWVEAENLRVKAQRGI